MTQAANIVGFDCEHTSDEPMAAQMVTDLCLAYPGHSWFVLIKGGVVQVKDMDLSDRWGMVLHYTQIKGDASERKRSLIRAAGEFLERANLRRGRKTDDVAMRGEGIPDKDMARMGLL
jgi:hypothetical protein